MKKDKKKFDKEEIVGYLTICIFFSFLIFLGWFFFADHGSSNSTNNADACKCVSVFNGQELKKSMGGVAGGDDYNKCLGKYKNWSRANQACAKYKKKIKAKKKETPKKTEGISKVTDPDGNIYEGEFVRGQFHGNGKMIYKNGSVYEGRWINMYRDGEGSITFSNDDVWEGKWNDGKPTINGKWKKYLHEDDPFFDLMTEKIETDPYFEGSVSIKLDKRKESTDKERLGYYNLTMMNVIPTSYRLSIINQYREFANGNEVYSEKFNVDAYLYKKEIDLNHLSNGYYHCEIRVDSDNNNINQKKFERKIRVRDSRLDYEDSDAYVVEEAEEENIDGYYNDSQSTGYVNVENLNFRSTPNIQENNIIGKLYNGQQVVIVNTIKSNTDSPKGLLKKETIVEYKGDEIKLQPGKAVDIIGQVDELGANGRISRMLYKCKAILYSNESINFNVDVNFLDIISTEDWSQIEIEDGTIGYVYSKFITEL